MTPVKPPLLYQLLHACLFLVGCCVYPHQSAAVVGLGVIYFILFFVVPIITQMMGRRLPTRSNPHAPSLQYPSYRYCRILVGCCVFLLSFGHKASSLPICPIFKGSLYNTQNRGTNRVERKPGAGCLAWVLW
jgi:hypothetical protein